MSAPRVVVPFVEGMLRRETSAALDRRNWLHTEYRQLPLAPQVHSTYYADLLAKEWELAQGVIIVEQDIVIRGGIIGELWSCTEDWCGFPYSVGGSPNGRMLGCTKFSAQLMRDEPDLIAAAAAIRFNAQCMPGCWHRLDGAVLQTLEARGYTWHEHLPPVEHLHEY